MVNGKDMKGDDWNEMAKHYKTMTVEVGKETIFRILAHANNALPWSQATGILDNGCGPGPVLSQLISVHGEVIPKDASIMAADFSSGMIDAVKNEKIENAGNPLWDRVETAVLDAMDMQGVADGSKSHITAGWVYFMTPDPQKCLFESRRILKDGGVLSLSSWQDNEWLPVMFAFRKIRPDVPMQIVPDEWRTVEGVSGELKKAGFKDVIAEEVQVSMSFESHDGFVKMICDCMPHLINLFKGMSDAEIDATKDAMLEELKSACPNEPGTLKGISVVGSGRK
ncbi:S-adenosyl-L-methionine-dependent methyltransferase [Polychaeton citri CBS 116435]|uniref:S-adenosyl-L-methionine-dependent methyltransferase n=1 Tax=Polychaeton citri CBS 116435 TaxID=1314669 RepID=A0A9P4QGH9_9PEZI|nr:S-adenosyl-L-methionine-dependent methyltransferase [Polychaeton citri CBS 116435]